MSKQKLGLGMSNDEARIEELEYIILGIMHSVDKWLEGDELMEDEVNRAATMREKVLRIIEEKDKEIARLEKELKRVRGIAEECAENFNKSFENSYFR